jgi:hypothetical protein
VALIPVFWFFTLTGAERNHLRQYLSALRRGGLS